jgi:hypothetical protein
MRRFLGRALPLAVLAAIAACIGFGRYHVSSLALGQSSASNNTFTVLLDGGSTNVPVGTFTTNYSPFTVTCQIITPSGDHSSAGATINLLASPDGTIYGTVADAGLSVTMVANGDGGAVVTTTGLAVSPQNPWLGYQILASGVATDGGTSTKAYLSCESSVLNVQTIH